MKYPLRKQVSRCTAWVIVDTRSQFAEKIPLGTVWKAAETFCNTRGKLSLAAQFLSSRQKNLGGRHKEPQIPYKEQRMVVAKAKLEGAVQLSPLCCPLFHSTAGSWVYVVILVVWGVFQKTRLVPIFCSKLPATLITVLDSIWSVDEVYIDERRPGYIPVPKTAVSHLPAPHFSITFLSILLYSLVIVFLSCAVASL